MIDIMKEQKKIDEVKRTKERKCQMEKKRAERKKKADLIAKRKEERDQQKNETEIKKGKRNAGQKRKMAEKVSGDSLSETLVEEVIMLESKMGDELMTDDSLEDVLTQFVPDGKVGPVCSNKKRDRKWIQCESCVSWFHYQCVSRMDLKSYSTQDIQEILFLCDFCM